MISSSQVMVTRIRIYSTTWHSHSVLFSSPPTPRPATGICSSLYQPKHKSRISPLPKILGNRALAQRLPKRRDRSGGASPATKVRAHWHQLPLLLSRPPSWWTALFPTFSLSLPFLFPSFNALLSLWYPWEAGVAPSPAKRSQAPHRRQRDEAQKSLSSSHIWPQPQTL